MRTSLAILVLTQTLLSAGCAEQHVASDDGGGSQDGEVRADAATDGGSEVDTGTIAPIDADLPPDAAIAEDASFAPDVGVDAGEACTTPGTAETVSCGDCGTTDRFCTAANVWAYGPCTGEGVCTPGTSMPHACGMCGTHVERCTTTCGWDTSLPCTGEGVCAPGTTTRTTMGCPVDQSRLLTCDLTCAYVAGTCEMSLCVPGTVTRVACGMCAMAVRTCDATGHWVDAACTDEGVCAPGSSGSRPCGLCGTQMTRCDTTCTVQPFGVCTGEITCGPPPPSVCVGATTLRTYASATCSTGACAYAPTDVTCGGGCSAGACTGPVALIRGLGGPAGFGPMSVASSDDGSSAAIAIDAAFPTGLSYYGTTYTSFYVNNNGNVSFGAPQAAYTPMFPGADTPMIAPWWADVDTRGAGQPARVHVVWFVDATRVIVTWHLVGYYAMHDTSQNSFQLILTNRSDVAPGDFDVELRYEQCQWTTGDASGGTGGLGGTPASAGFDAADGLRSLALPGSGAATVLGLCTTSNVGVPGLWRYQVRGGAPL